MGTAHAEVVDISSDSVQRVYINACYSISCFWGETILSNEITLCYMGANHPLGVLTPFLDSAQPMSISCLMCPVIDKSALLPLVTNASLGPSFKFNSHFRCWAACGVRWSTVFMSLAVMDDLFFVYMR